MKKNNSVVSLSFLILFLLISCEKSSSDWIQYVTDKKGSVISYRKDGIKTSNNEPQVWLKKIYSDEGRKEEIHDRKKREMSTDGYDKLSHILLLVEINCKNNSVQMLSGTDFDDKGNKLYSHSSDIPKWTNIFPDSTWDKLLSEFCK